MRPSTFQNIGFFLFVVLLMFAVNSIGGCDRPEDRKLEPDPKALGAGRHEYIKP